MSERLSLTSLATYLDLGIQIQLDSSLWQGRQAGSARK